MTTPHRRLRADRQHAHRGAGRTRRLDRLAVRAALRFASLLRRAARQPRARALVAGAGGESCAPCAAAIAATRSMLETEFETGRGHGAADRLHAAVAGSNRCRAHRRRRARSGTDAHGAHHPLRLRRRSCHGCAASRARCSRPQARTRSSCARRSRREARASPPSQSSRYGAGERIPFVLSHFPSHQPRPLPIDADAAIAATELAVAQLVRALHIRRALGRRGQAIAHHAEGAHLCADRRHRRCGDDVAAGAPSAACVTGTIDSAGRATRRTRCTRCLLAGYHDEARAWREWLLRAAAGRPQDLQTVYGVAGERQLTELELPWLPGYDGSAPVRIGNAAAAQCQLDVYGEVIDALYLARTAGLDPGRQRLELPARAARVSRVALEQAGQRHLGSARRAAAFHAFEGHGMGRVRSRDQGSREPRARRAGSSAGAGSARGSTPRSAARASSAKRGTFVQYYGSDQARCEPAADSAGRLPAARRSARAGTVEAIERELMFDGLVVRYRDDEASRWPAARRGRLPAVLVLARRQSGACRARTDDAEALFERLLALRNDVGPARRRIRSALQPSARQLPAGADARRADQHRAQPVASWRAERAPQRRHGAGASGRFEKGGISRPIDARASTNELIRRYRAARAAGELEPPACTVSSNASSPLSSVIGEGGQPRMCRSTGRTAETPPTQA